MLRVALIAALAALFIFSFIQLARYLLEFIGSKQTSEALRQAYYEQEPEQPEPTAAAFTPMPATRIPSVTVPAMPTLSPRPDAYPNNAGLTIAQRFVKLRRRNADIIGWLNIAGVLDEAVVQRDNAYYLRRDYLGYHNENGALFLDENCDLSGRPSTLMIFGHNMKTGTMFGCLRNFETLSYYKRNAFVSFDTLYEDGQYVVFATATIDLRLGTSRYVDLYQLYTNIDENRQSIIDKLLRYSCHTSSIDVRADDQLLLFVTCIGDDNERRVVAARRLRSGETTEQLQKIVDRSIKRESR